MAKLTVLEVPHPALRQKAEPVARVDASVRQLLQDMLETMYARHGVGLAGNQVGILKRVVVADCGSEEPEPILLVNPEIVAHSETLVCRNEGCLSLPQEYADVERFENVCVRYLDAQGVPQLCQASGLLAVALQHEIDHLDGKLFIDYLSPLRRRRLLAHLKKRRQAEEQEAAGEEK